jgi:plastocyanin
MKIGAMKSFREGSTGARVAALTLALALPAAFPVVAHAASHTVRIEGMKFQPERLEIRAGDTVTWVNADLVPHTVTAASRSIDSGSIAPNAKWTKVVRGRGEIDYVCRFHPTMKGVLVVK